MSLEFLGTITVNEDGEPFASCKNQDDQLLSMSWGSLVQGKEYRQKKGLDVSGYLEALEALADAVWDSDNCPPVETADE